MGIYHIIYVSKAKHEFSLGEIEKLTWNSSLNNSKMGITGLLLFYKGSFIQILEGDEKAVTTVFDKISIDTRHTDIKTLGTFSNDERYFENWGMGMVYTSDDNVDFVMEKMASAEDLYKLSLESSLIFLKSMSVLVK